MTIAVSETLSCHPGGKIEAVAVYRSWLDQTIKALFGRKTNGHPTRPGRRGRRRGARYAYQLLQQHFGETRPEEIVTSTRRFPARMRADLQGAIEQLFADQSPQVCVGLHQKHQHQKPHRQQSLLPYQGPQKGLPISFMKRLGPCLPPLSQAR